jgi:hypothetical protein
MNVLNLRQVRMSGAVGLLAAAAMLAAPAAMAQQKQKVSFDVPAASTKYTQQHTVDVGDVPGHQVRVFEIQRIYGGNAPVVQGVRVKESWTRGLTDFTEFSGLGTSYNTYVMDNGDKIYSRGNFIAQSTDAKGGLKNVSTSTITGGTGKFQSIRGIVKSETIANPAAGTNQTKGEMEYWMEK